MSDAAVRERVLEGIYAVLPDVLAADAAGPVLTEETLLMKDLGMTSVATLELMLGLEDALEIQIDIEKIEPDDVASVGALASFIAAQMAVPD